MRVTILYNQPVPGDVSSQDVLAQAALVETALSELGHETERLEVAGDLRREVAALVDAQPDAVFNLAESVNDDPRLYPCVAAMLELLGLPFTGCGSAAMTASTDKHLAKLAMTGAGLPTPAWRLLDGDTPPAYASVPPRWIVKPNLEDASIGIDAETVFDDAAALDAALPRLWEQHGRQPMLVEHFIDGREFNVSVLETERGLDVLPVPEIDFSAFGPDQLKIVGYRAKWHEGAFEYEHTPRVFHRDSGDPLIAELRSLTIEACKLFRVRGYARVDFRVDEAGRPFILEVNANPCLSPDAGFLAAAKEAGMSPAEVADALLRAALKGGARDDP